MQHAGGDWREKKCTLYHSCLIPKNHDVPDAVVSLIEAALLWVQRRPRLLERGLDQYESELDGDAVS